MFNLLPYLAISRIKHFSYKAFCGVIVSVNCYIGLHSKIINQVLLCFIVATSTWSQPMHKNACTLTPRAAHTMCSIGEQLIIFGGRDCDSRVNDLHFYDTGKLVFIAFNTKVQYNFP